MFTQKGIIDVTKPPYNVDNTGKKDCTETLCRIIDEILLPNIEKLEEAKKKLAAIPDENARVSFEIWRMNGSDYVIFPEFLEPTKIIYFPEGTYLVSDTITYSHENLKNFYASKPYFEMNRQIHFKGAGKDKVTIKLQDNCKGFEFGNNRPVISFMRAETTNIAMQNFFEDITVDIGSGNPGATGIHYFANNSGAVRNVVIKSSDPKGRGFAGLAITNERISGCIMKNIEVEGFDYGFYITPDRIHSVYENIFVKNQRKVGFLVGDNVISMRNFKSENSVPAMQTNGQCAHITLLDADLRGGDCLTSALDIGFGQVWVRNIRSYGYNCALAYGKSPVREGMEMVEMTYVKAVGGGEEYISEYCSGDVFTAFPCEEKSLNLPIEDAPEIVISDNPEEWACVTEFGAVTDRNVDSTEAIQKAMNSGKKYICFEPGSYLVDGTITIPATVEVVDFRFCDFKAGKTLREMKGGSNFKIVGESDKPILIQNVFTWEQYFGWFRFLEQASTRTLVMKDLHTQTAAMYFNSVPGGKVFIEDCACTLGAYDYATNIPYEFHEQKVWARQIDPERSFCQMYNDGSDVWIMGFKAEGPGTMFKTVNGGRTEILGGAVCLGQGRPFPIIYNDNSEVSARFATVGYTFFTRFPNVVTEIRDGREITLKEELFPIRTLKCIECPMYVGKTTDKK